MTIEKSGNATQIYQLKEICREKGITDPIAIRREMAKLGLDFDNHDGIDKHASGYNGEGIKEYLEAMSDAGMYIVKRR